MMRLMDWKGCVERRENDGFRYVTLENLVLHETRREIINNDITPPQNIRKKERITLWKAR